MSIEYLLVKYVDDRDVLADGNKVGTTNHTLMLQTNEYDISLGGDGYTPAIRDVVLAGTTIEQPKIVTFEPIAKGA